MIRLSGLFNKAAGAFLAMMLPLLAEGQEPAGIRLAVWPDGAPESNGLRGDEIIGDDGQIRNISQAELIVFPAEHPNGQAILMCPGGNYEYLTLAKEGTDMAPWFNERGITFAVLKYRLPNAHSEVPLTDAQRALTLMRSHAQEWGFTQLGIMGAAAGGHLAASAAVHATARTLPDFQILLYPIITFEGRITPGAPNMLFDMYPDDDEVYYFCCDQFVTEDTPPAFLVHCEDDAVFPASESRLYAAALERNGVSATLLTFPDGGHGWGFSDAFPHKAEWTAALESWLGDLR